MPPDLLSAFLSPCRIQCRGTRPLRLTAPWGLRFDESGPGFFVVLEGECLLRIDAMTDDLPVHQNDLVVFTREADFAILDRPHSRLVPADQLLERTAVMAQPVQLGGGGKGVRLLWGELVPADDYTRQAFALLPPLLVARGDAPEIAAGMGPLLRLFVDELEQHRPGGDLLVERVLQAMLVYALRLTSFSLPAADGFMPSLAVPGLGLAVGAIHSRPEHDWSVRELAELAGLSRSKFAARFLEVLGRPPVDYLREVRMRLACQLLNESDFGIKEIAVKVGYATEASFSKAFARSCGCAPGEYRRAARGAAPAGQHPAGKLKIEN